MDMFSVSDTQQRVQRHQSNNNMQNKLDRTYADGKHVFHIKPETNNIRPNTFIAISCMYVSLLQAHAKTN